MNGQNLLELFERYLKGDLSGQQLQELEKTLQNDPVVKEAFNDFKEFHGKLEFYGQRRRLISRLNEYHEELERKSKKASVIKLNTYKFIAIAASTGVLFLLTASFIIGYYFYSKKE